MKAITTDNNIFREYLMDKTILRTQIKIGEEILIKHKGIEYIAIYGAKLSPGNIFIDTEKNEIRTFSHTDNISRAIIDQNNNKSSPTFYNAIKIKK